MPRTHTTRSLTILALLFCLASSAEAQTTGDGVGTTAPSEEPRARALPIFQRGVTLVAEERWSEALEVFLEARAIFDSPILAFNIGVVQRALGQYVASLETLRGFLASPLEGVAATRRPDAENLVRELVERIGSIRVEVPLDLASAAEVAIDGRALTLDGARVTLTVDPGPHTVQVRHAGYTPLFLDRRVPPGTEVVVTAQLERLPAHLAVTASVPNARVRLDGEALGTAPYEADVEPGVRELVVEADGHVPHRATLRLEPGGSAAVAADLAVRGAEVYEEWWFWTIIVGAVAGAAVGTYFAVRPEPPFDGGSIGWVVGGSM